MSSHKSFQEYVERMMREMENYHYQPLSIYTSAGLGMGVGPGFSFTPEKPRRHVATFKDVHLVNDGYNSMSSVQQERKVYDQITDVTIDAFITL
jgi:hypothetical protein